jgi:uncharacterized protein (DUF362 family)
VREGADDPTGVDRRSFLGKVLRAGLTTTLAGTIYGSDLFGMPQALAQQAAPVVVAVRHSGLTAAREADRRAVYGAMLDAALASLSGVQDVRAGLWRRYVPVDKVIGLKVNCLAGLGMSTDPQLTYAVAEGLISAGCPPQNIIAFDRTDSDLVMGGYPIVTDGPTMRVYGSANEAAGYEDKLTRFGEAGDRFSRILTEQIGVLVNLPILKDHALAGMTAALKNHFGCLQNPNKFHAGNCDPFIADLNKLRVIRRKQCLSVVDCREVLYQGGPSDQPDYHYEANTILVGTDPVALDAVAWQMLEGIRAEKGLGTLESEGRPPRHIATAAQYELGIADLAQIRCVTVELG